MFASTKYSRVERITWTLEPYDVTRAIREFVEKHGHFTKHAANICTVELDPDTGGAIAIWVNEQAEEKP